MDRLARGRQGESLAASLLLGAGYKLLAQNWVVKQGEVDLLMVSPDDAIVIVEVKSVTRLGEIHPLHKIGPQKQRKLALLAQVVAARYPDQNIRIDAITVYWKQSGEPVLQHFSSIMTL